MFYRVPSSFIYFISGIFVAVAANLITSNPADIFNSSGGNALMLDSIPWLACAAFLTILAIHLATAENDYANSTLKSLSVKECRELKKSIYAKYYTKLTVLSLLIFISFGVGVYFSINNPVTPQQPQLKEKVLKDSITLPAK